MIPLRVVMKMSPTYLVLWMTLLLIEAGVITAYWPPIIKEAPLDQPGDHACQQIVRSRELATVTKVTVSHHRVFYKPCGDFIKLFTCTVRRAVYKTSYKREMRTGYKIQRVCCPGYQTNGTICHPCLPGSYGINCDFTCSSLCLQSEHGSCRPADGRCTCLSGYYGVMCEEECPSDRFGPDCQHRCSCSNTASCAKETGLCRCDPGQRNDQCLLAMSSRSDGDARSSHSLTMLLFLLVPLLNVRLAC